MAGNLIEAAGRLRAEAATDDLDEVAPKIRALGKLVKGASQDELSTGEKMAVMQVLAEAWAILDQRQSDGSG